MTRTYFGMGAFATSRDGNVDEARERHKAMQPLPDVNDERHEAQLGEWLKSRSPTSHQAVGVEAGEMVRFIDDSGERRDAMVLGEERNAHNSTVDVHLAANDPNGSGTYKLTFEPNGARGMIETRAKRIHE